MDALLEAKAGPTLCDDRGWNSLCHALSTGEVDLARRLLELTARTREVQTCVARRYRKDVVKTCKQDVSAEVANLVQREFEPLGFLALEPAVAAMSVAPRLRPGHGPT